MTAANCSGTPYLINGRVRSRKGMKFCKSCWFLTINILPYMHPKGIFTISQSRNHLNENKIGGFCWSQERGVLFWVSIYRHKTPINSTLHSCFLHNILFLAAAYPKLYHPLPWIQEQRKAAVAKRSRWRKWAMRATSKSPSPSAEAAFSRRRVSSAPSAEPMWRWWCSRRARRCSPSATPTWTPWSTAFWGGHRCRTRAPCSSSTPTASPTCVTWTSSWLRWTNFWKRRGSAGRSWAGWGGRRRTWCGGPAPLRSWVWSRWSSTRQHWRSWRSTLPSLLRGQCFRMLLTRVISFSQGLLPLPISCLSHSISISISISFSPSFSFSHSLLRCSLLRPSPPCFRAICSLM